MEIINNINPILTLKQALDIIGGMSFPRKMEVPAIGLPIKYCRTGKKLRVLQDKKGRVTVCSNCYAGKGAYIQYEYNVAPAQERRRIAIDNPRWVDAFVYILTHQKQILKHKAFRWHDSGDIQNPDHLDKIVQIARRTPNIRHWLPTKEANDVRNYKGDIPDNLVIRLSGTFVDGSPPNFKHTSVATSDVDKVTCNASLPKDHPNTQKGCQSCRKCWDATVKNVAYFNH
jgi:hypothetical protein